MLFGKRFDGEPAPDSGNISEGESLCDPFSHRRNIGDVVDIIDHRQYPVIQARTSPFGEQERRHGPLPDQQRDERVFREGRGFEVDGQARGPDFISKMAECSSRARSENGNPGRESFRMRAARCGEYHGLTVGVLGPAFEGAGRGGDDPG